MTIMQFSSYHGRRVVQAACKPQRAIFPGLFGSCCFSSGNTGNCKLVCRPKNKTIHICCLRHQLITTSWRVSGLLSSGQFCWGLNLFCHVTFRSKQQQIVVRLMIRLMRGQNCWIISKQVMMHVIYIHLLMIIDRTLLLHFLSMAVDPTSREVVPGLSARRERQRRVATRGLLAPLAFE